MMKIKRKVHNKLFPTRKLAFYQHSKVDEWNSLECYMDKWLLVILFMPIVVIGTLVSGFPTAFKEATVYFNNPYSVDSLTLAEVESIKRLQEK
ncbi:hypothetical protein [Providencia alcalifaciens]|uniref:hypothetical protein n=1 Tax=Providencia alcalifaciens TaxID=126385 RepID=UPI0018A7212B|nr:hypothetical protein [Providencia alcalifaciens]